MTKTINTATFAIALIFDLWLCWVLVKKKKENLKLGISAPLSCFVIKMLFDKRWDK